MIIFVFMEDNKILLLTACVNPNGMSFTKIQDTNLRLSEYISAIFWYLKNTSLPIVVCENTLYDFSNDFEDYLSSGRLELLCFNGNGYERSLGKGYGEALIIDYAIKHSKLITEKSIIIKITGRIIINNIRDIIIDCNNQNNIYADAFLIDGRMQAASRIFISPYLFLTNYFLSNLSSLNDSKYYYFEHLLYDSSKKWEIDKMGKFVEPKRVIIYTGISGSTGCSLSISYIKIIRVYLSKKLKRIGIYRNTNTGKLNF